MEQILQQLSDERREQNRENRKTQQIPEEPHPRANPQTKTELTRDDKIENPDPSSPTVAAKQTRDNPDTLAKQSEAADNEASTVKAAEGAPDKNKD